MFSTRTIFLAIRGIDQTGRAMASVKKGLTEVEERQESLSKASYRMLFAGAAFASFGAMATKAIMNTLDSTQRGIRILDDFGVVLNRVKTAFAEGIIDRYGEDLEKAVDRLNEIAKGETIGEIAEIALPVTLTLTILGLSMLTAGIVTGFLTQLAAAFGAFASTAGLAAPILTAAGVLQIALPLLILASLAWIFDVGGVRTAMENTWTKLRETWRDIMLGERAADPEALEAYDVAEASGALRYGLLMNPTLTTLQQTVLIETYITTADDETVMELIAMGLIKGYEQINGEWTYVGTGP